MRRIASMVALALVMTLALDGIAVAAAATDTTFRMRDQGGYVEYKGRVDSSSDRCLKNRIVEIYHDGVKIGETTTDEDGRWETTGPTPPDGDKVTAKVLPKKRRGRTICKGTQNTKTFQAAD